MEKKKEKAIKRINELSKLLDDAYKLIEASEHDNIGQTEEKNLNKFAAKVKKKLYDTIQLNQEYLHFSLKKYEHDQ